MLNVSEEGKKTWVMSKLKTFVLKSDMQILFMQKGCQHKTVNYL